MRNIHEFIGIIKGVNFDGIVNEAETKELQTWLVQNRNLAYDSHQQKLISMLDSILEDGVIDDDERKLMLKYASEYTFNYTDENSSLYELNGIIRGITSDNVVNEDEMYRLKNWLDENADIKDSEEYLKLYKSVCEIIEDNIITVEEQTQLLSELKMLIDNSKFEGKIKLLRRLASSKKNIGIELIDILDDERAINYIHTSSKTILMKMLRSYSGFVADRKDDVFISLVLIALLNYDSNYYNSVQEIYDELYMMFPKQKIEGTIRSVINLYKTDDSSNGRTRIINTVLKNAIVPQYYLPAFFEFVFDIYKLNFECELTDNLEEEFQFIYEGLRGSLDTDGDELRLKVTKKTYKLIKSTKMLMLSGSIDALIKLSIIIVRLIDKYYWDMPLRVVNPYLKYGFEAWAGTLKEKAKDSNKVQNSGLHSSWEPKFVLEGNSVLLITPVHRIKSDYDYRDIVIEVRNGNNVVYYNASPDIRDIIGGYQIPSFVIRIDQPIGELEYIIKAKGDTIYESKDKLFRKWLVFNNDGEEINNNSNYEGKAFFCVNDIELNMYRCFQGDSYKLYEKVVKLGDVVRLGGNVFNFSKMTKPGIFGEEFVEPIYIEKQTGDRLKVYKSITNLVIECDNNIERIEIFINGKIHKLSDYEYEKYDRPGVIKYIIELAINEAGIYDLSFKLYAEGKVVKNQKFLFAIDRKLKWDVQKIDDSYYCLLYSDIIGIEKEIYFVAETFNKELFEFEKDDTKYMYLVPLNIDLYSLDGVTFHEMNAYIWCEDIKVDTCLYLLDYRPVQVLIKSSDDNPIGTIELDSDGVGVKASIGVLVTWKYAGDYVELNFITDNKLYFKTRMYCRCVLDKETTKLLYNAYTGELMADIRYWGRGDVRIEVWEDESKVFASETIQSGDVLNIPNIESFKKYYISVIEKKKGLFLGSSKREVYRFDISFVAWRDLVGKTFKFDRIYFDQEIRGKFVRKRWHFNNTYLKILEYDGKNTYSAEIFARLKTGKMIDFDNINPVNVELCSNNIDGEVELAIDKDGDGLLLDFEHGTVMDTLLDDKATDIFSYILNVGGVAYE